MFTNRSTQKELLDLGPAFYSQDEYQQCLQQLFTINKLLGFFQQTVNILKRFPANASLVDIGCGGGLFLLHLSQYFPQMSMTGLDIAPEAITIAQHQLQQWQQKTANLKVAFQLQNNNKPELNANSVDIIITTLVCHHLDDNALIDFLKHTLQAARTAVIINDLHRHPIAYWFYKIVTPLFFRNRLINHDGLISIQRSFTRSELKHLLQQAGINNYQLRWGFPFRWSLILWKK